MTETDLKYLYLQYVNKYFPTRWWQMARRAEYKDLFLLLEAEKVDAIAYLDYCFGILENKSCPSPKKLTNPLLIKDFRATIK